MKKRLLAWIVTVCMVFSLFPVTALAADPASAVAKIGETGYETLQAAVDAAQPGDTITLLDTMEGNGVKVPTGKDIIFDFAGFTYTINTKTVGSTGTETNGFQLLKGATVVMKNGTLNAGTSAKILVQKYCDLTLEDMNLVGGPQTSYVLSNNNATTTLKGNTNITAADGQFAFDAYYWPSNTYGDNYVVTENLTGTITGKIEHTHDNTATDEEAKAHSGIALSSGNYTVDPTPYLAEGMEATQNADGTFGVAEKTYVAQIGEQKFETLADAVAAAKPGETVKLIADVVMPYPTTPGDGLRPDIIIDKDLTLDLAGYTVKRNACTGSVNGVPAFFAITAGVNMTVTGNGTMDTELGDNSCYGINVNHPDAVLTIENGTFLGAPTAFQVQTGTLNVKGGTFDMSASCKAAAPAMAKYIINCIDKSFKDGTAKIIVTGGTFGFDPSADPEGTGTTYVAEGYEAVQNGESWSVAVKKAPAVAEVYGVQYETLEAAVNAAQAGETVTLLQDVVLSETVVLDKNIALNLNGHTVSSAEGFDAAQYLFESKAPEVKYKKVQIQNGSIVSATARGVHATGGRLYLEALNMSTFKRCLHVEHAEVKLDQGSVLEICQGGVDPAIYIGSKDTTQTKQPTLEVKAAKVDASKGEYTFAAIQGNGSDTSNPYIKVFDGAELISAGDAIYAPQEGLVYIYGGTLTGSTAIEIRAGRLYIKGGVFNATAEAFAEQPSGNGSTVEGAAVAVSQHTTNKDLDVTILDGTFNGIYAFYEKDLQDTQVANITGSIRGGNFNGMVYSQNLKNFIKEGIFTEEPAAEYIAVGYSAQKNADGKFVVAKTPVAMIGTQGYETLRDAIDAAKSGDTVKLVDNIELIKDYGFEQICVTTQMTLDFNGHTITSNHAGKNNSAVLFVNAGGDLTLTGEGGINVLNGGYCVHVNGADAVLNVEAGTYHGAVTALNVQKGTANVKGGSFSVAPTADGKYDYLLNCIDSAYTDKSAKIVVTGGTFEKFNPAASNGEPNGPANLVAEGYEAVQNGESWTVAEKKTMVAEVAGKQYTTLQEAVAAAQPGETVKLLTDVAVDPVDGEANHLAPAITITSDLILDLNGKTIGWNQSRKEEDLPMYPLFFAITEPVNVTITGNGKVDVALGNNGSYGINLNNPNAALTIENGTFLGGPTAIQVQQGTLNVKGGTYALTPASNSEYTKYIINCIDRYFQDGTAKINVTGGTFGFDPSADPEGANTTYLAPGYKAVKDGANWTVQLAGVAMIEETKTVYDSVSEAVAAAQQGQTIVLLQETTDNTIFLVDPVTLDLNGRKLTANRVVALEGAKVLDNGANKGALVVPQNKLVLDENNGQLPIWNGSAYVFMAMDMKQYKAAEDASSFRFIFKPTIKGDDKSFTQSNLFWSNGAEPTGIKMGVRIKWRDNKSDGTFTQDFVYSENFVKLVYGMGKSFDLKVAGLSNADKFADVEYCSIVIAENGAVITGAPIAYTANQK